MTKEEREKAIDLLDNLVGMIEDNQGNDFALKKGIEALKEEPVIDKIRAEIKALSPEPTAEDVVDGNPTKDAVWEILIEVLKIIDKYDQSSSEILTSSIHCQHTDAEIAKSFIEDVESVKAQPLGGDQMDFPNTFDEFAKDYGFKDKDEVYTNGSELIPVFRVKQWLEHIEREPCEDCVSRQDIYFKLTNGEYPNETIEQFIDRLVKELKALPSVTPKGVTVTDFADRCRECGAKYGKALKRTRWIPVSERLPDDSGEYLVSVTDKEDEDYKQVGVAWFAHPKDYDIQDGEWRELMIDEIVVAWMPKPKAYSEVEE